MTLKVSCPTCNKDVIWQASSTFRPFCCKRCQLIDLGDWAEENHKISQSAQGANLLAEDLTEEMLDAMEDEFLMNNKFFVEPE